MQFSPNSSQIKTSMGNMQAIDEPLCINSKPFGLICGKINNLVPGAPQLY